MSSLGPTKQSGAFMNTTGSGGGVIPDSAAWRA